MTIEYSFDSRNNMVKTKVSGCLTTTEIKHHFNQLLQDKMIREGFVEVVNLDDTYDFHSKFSDICELNILGEQLKEKGHVITIFSVCNFENKSIISMMSYLFQNIPISIYVCNEEKEVFEHLSLLSEKRRSFITNLC